jgi:pSer/pThr/pTyr-binding forkhead associated (FHA) protein
VKLTVYFKEHLIQEHFIEFDEIVIGSGAACDLVIDSLAVSAEHCKVTQRDDGLYLEALDPESPTLVNGTAITSKHALSDKDTFSLGKHTIEFTGNPEQSQSLLRHKHEASLNHQGCLQIMSGENLGRIIRLSKTHIKLGRDGSDSALITQKSEGYYLSASDKNNSTKIGSSAIGDTPELLKENDLIEIDNITMQFFFDASLGD